MSTLPTQVPPELLDAIKSAVGQKWWQTVLTTVLGSSIIAGGISFCGDNYRDKRNANREAQKSLQKETIDSYGELGKKIQEFQSSLNSATAVFKFALKTNDKTFNKEVDKSRVAVARQIASVVRALNAPRITDKDVKAKVQNLFVELPGLLEESQKDKKALDKVIKLCTDKLDQDIDSVKSQIETIRNSVPLEPTT